MPCVSAAVVAKTLPLPCVSAAVVVKTLPLPCVSAAFVAKTLPLTCAAGVAKTAPFLAAPRRSRLKHDDARMLVLQGMWEAEPPIFDYEEKADEVTFASMDRLILEPLGAPKFKCCCCCKKLKAPPKEESDDEDLDMSWCVPDPDWVIKRDSDDDDGSGGAGLAALLGIGAKGQSGIFGSNMPGVHLAGASVTATQCQFGGRWPVFQSERREGACVLGCP